MTVSRLPRDIPVLNVYAGHPTFPSESHSDKYKNYHFFRMKEDLKT